MRQILLLAALLISAPSASLQAEETATQLRQMAWLAGTWKRVELPDGQSGYERWTYDDAQGFVGIGVTERNGKTTFEEKLRIVPKDGTVYYVADVPENAQPVYFKLTKLSETEFSFENPTHDFPQKIAYRKDGSHLHVKVFAGEKAEQFEFERQR
ncbi:DUF6265 family protein [Pseudoxanthomonas sp. UTMC 1351]|uniref:DUF6265 family protein n=1 Tax=Pseudoxanthomonas sp. UTMC 1351 TaxID=2695853 RepID=UPI0034CFDECD